jgi:cytochrome c biogenesis protein ResB
VARVATTAGWTQSLRGFDPFKTLFRLLTSVRVALLLLGAVAVAALLGVIFPQAPDEVRAVPSAYDAYTEFQRTRYGVFTDAMRRLGLFEVFHSYWFNGLILVLLIAVAVCTFSRNVRRPVRRVNDRYFERAHHRAEFATPQDAGSIAAQLRKRHYRVEETRRDGEAVYLFAERFQWAQYGTFVSHLALILFMAGAIVTKVVGFNTTIEIPEGGTYPVFPTIHAGQLQVQDVHSATETDSRGNVTSYISNLAVYREGQLVCSGTSTVNNPMHCAGYTFHQTTMSDGVALQVRDATTGQLVYDEVPEIGTAGSAPSPRLQVRDSQGVLLFDDNVVLAPFDPGSMQELYAILPIVPASTGAANPLAIVLAAVEGGSAKQWTIHISIVGTQRGQPGNDLILPPGGSASAGGFQFAVPQLNGIPLSVVQGIPGMESAAILQLETDSKGRQYLDVLNLGSGQAAGSDQSASGSDTAATPTPQATPVPTDSAGASAAPAGAPQTSGRLDLMPGQAQRLGNYTYTFVGEKSITGITVRKDPGSTFIWVATALLLLGVATTFYLPRRRLWVRITPERTYMAGVADRIVNFAGEMRTIGAAAGSPDALLAEED